MFTVSDLAKASQVTADTVRHYVKLGLLNPTRDCENGYKLFSSNDITRVHFIRNAKSLGFTLKEISEIFDRSKEGTSPCPEVRETLQKHIELNKKQLEEMIVLQKRMQFALLKWQEMPNGMPDGNSICHLIESIAGENVDE